MSGLPRIYAVGHSTRSLAELVELLHHYGVTTLADIRTIPRSRHNPQFNRAELDASLPHEDIGYVHLPRLGGLRHNHGKASLIADQVPKRDVRGGGRS